jgi:hypothetical protein
MDKLIKKNFPTPVNIIKYTKVYKIKIKLHVKG